MLVDSIFTSPLVNVQENNSIDHSIPEIFTPTLNNIPHISSDQKEGFTTASWESHDDSTSDNWSWENRNWLYGPNPYFSIYYDNKTEVSLDNFIQLDANMTLSAIIPKSILKEDEEIGWIRFTGWYKTSDEEFSASFNIGWSIIPEDPITWWVDSEIENASADDGELQFIAININQCAAIENEQTQMVNFSIRFLENTPIGLYGIYWEIRTTSQHTIGFYHPSEYDDIAIGIERYQALDSSYGGSYTVQKLDMDNETLYSVSRNENFIMQIAVTGDTPLYVRLGFRMPGWINKLTNVTGYHTVEKNEIGGWQYDENLNTYVWNASAVVTYEELVYGIYETQELVQTNNMLEIEHRVLEYNEGIWEVVHKKDWVERQFWYVYNVTSGGTWNIYFGYEYWDYPSDTYIPEVYEQIVKVYESLPEEMPVLYELNESLSFATLVDNQLVVNFVGSFTNDMPSTSSYSDFTFTTEVVGPESKLYIPDCFSDTSRQTYEEYEAALAVIIETPVTIVKLLNDDDSEINGEILHVEKNDVFKVLGQLQGGSSIAGDIDGVSFSIATSQTTNHGEETQTTRLSYDVMLDMDGVPTYSAFNWTTKMNLTYGIHERKVLIELADWNYVYNSTTGSWEWQYGTFSEWRWIEVEEWYWESWYYNQASQSWQLDYLPYRRFETAIQSAFCSIDDFLSWNEDGDLYASFRVNASNELPDASYNWDFAFMNNTCHEDSTSEWGKHEISTWENERIYNFMYEDNRVYVDPIVENQLAYYNDTLVAFEGTEYLLGKEQPYVEVNGEKLSIKSREVHDPASGTSYTTIFYWDYTDELEGREYYYYELSNGSKLPVTYDDIIYIYNVTLGNGESFYSTQENYQTWNFNGQIYYSWIDIDGMIHQGTSIEIYTNANVIFHEKALPPKLVDGKLVRYGLNHTLEISSFRWESSIYTYIMTDTLGNLYILEFNHSAGYYEAFIDDTWEHVSWPTEFFIIEFEGREIKLLADQIKRYWYHLCGGEYCEMPYVDANAVSLDELSSTIVNGGKVPVAHFLFYANDIYPVVNTTLDDHRVLIDDTEYQVEEYYLSYTNANGTYIWEPTHIGYEVSAGYYTNLLDWNTVKEVNYTSTEPLGYPTYLWTENAYTLELMNQTTWLVNSTYVFVVYSIDFEGKTFYSTMDWPRYYQVDNEVWWAFTAINGSMFNLTSMDPTHGWKITDNSIAYTFGIYGNDLQYEFMGQVYTAEPALWPESIWTFRVLNASYPGDLFLDWDNRYKLYEFEYNGQTVIPKLTNENVLRNQWRWGYAFVYAPESIESTTYKNVQNLIIGYPDTGMWGLKLWSVNDENGALDLDGDLDTSDDQYYVLEILHSEDTWSHEWEKMRVSVVWNPDTTILGDEVRSQSWMGIDTFIWTFEWNETFLWYHADTLSQLANSEMEAVKDSILTLTGSPRPGYWDIAWMTKNATWDDIVTDAITKGWDWITSNEKSWVWLSFGMGQEYGTSFMENDTMQLIELGMQYEFSGLMIWEDYDSDYVMDVNIKDLGTGELTHYLMFESVNEVDFITPGDAYGNTESSGFIVLGSNNSVIWGVSFNRINGTLYPFTLESYWGWYEGIQIGSDKLTFDERPIRISIDELSFWVSFQGGINTTLGALNNQVNLKVHNYVGNWDYVDYPGGMKNLENRSLAINYFGDVEIIEFNFLIGNTSASNEDTISGDTFDFNTAGTIVAQMIMGNSSYDWGNDAFNRYNVTSHTTPQGAFRAAFLSDNGQSATAWTFTSTQYYISIGFPEWGGYSVYQDPVFVAYTSVNGTESGQEVIFDVPITSPQDPTANDNVEVSANIYTDTNIHKIELLHSTDQSNWLGIEMSLATTNTWEATLPKYSELTTVWYKIQATTDTGIYESVSNSYMVRTIITSYTTSTSTPPQISGEMIVIVLVIIFIPAIGILIARRRRH